MFFRMKLGRCPRSTAGQLLNKMSNTQDLYLLRVQEYGPSTAKWRPLLGSLQSTVLLTYRQLFRDMKGNEGKILIWSLVRGTLCTMAGLAAGSWRRTGPKIQPWQIP